MITMPIAILVIGQFIFPIDGPTRPYPLTGVDQKPKLVKFVEPAFPNNSKLKTINTVVVVNVLVDTTGHAIAARFRDTLDPELKEAIMASIKGMEFEPARDSAGNPVEVWFPLSIPISDMDNWIPPPVFPEKADSYGIDSGKVIVDVHVGADGSVIEAKVRESSNILFESSALSSAMNAHFSNSVATRWFTIVYHFKKEKNE